MPKSPYSLRRALLPVLVCVAACRGEDPTDATSDAAVTVVTVAPAKDSLSVGDTLRLSATVSGRRQARLDVSPVWSSSDPAVATVSSTGMAIATGAGTALITARAGGRSGTATLLVTDPRPPEAPDGLVAVPVSDTLVSLAWHDRSDNEDAFSIERGSAPAGTAAAAAANQDDWVVVATVDAGVTAFVDGKLTPSTAYRYRVLARNANGESAYTDPADATTYATLEILTETLEDGTRGLHYSQTLEAGGGDGTFTWTLADGELPAGIELAADGAVAGTPTEVGAATFSASVAGGGQTERRAFTITVNEQILPPTVETGTLPDGSAGNPYAVTLRAAHGDGSYAWAVTSGSLPDGLALGADGSLSGTPTRAGAAHFTVSVTSAGMSGSAELSLVIHPPLAVNPDPLPPGRVGSAYEAHLSASGGDGSYAWSFGPSHPEWLSLSPEGEVSGTPPEEGTVAVAVVVASGDGQSAAAQLDVRIYEVLRIGTTSLPDGQVGTPYSNTLIATGGTGENSWSVTEGTVPPGLSLAPGTGALTGQPTVSGTSTFTVGVSSSDGQSATTELHIVVSPGPVIIATISLPPPQVAVPYDVSLTATGGDGTSYAWSVETGALPTGLTLSPSGRITGVPIRVEAATFTARVESGGQWSAHAYTLVVLPAPPIGYDIDLVYLSPVSAIDQAAFESARTRWEGVIWGDVQDVTTPLASCGSFHPATPGGVDDLIIYITVDSIDGPFGTLGQAGPCYVRADGKPITGAMIFDEADLAWLASHGLLVTTILHEMGHVVGVGSIWSRLGFLSGSCTGDPIFTGAAAVAAFDEVGGTGYTGGGKVPVENTGTPGNGSNCSHWRESVFGNELMTPILDNGPDPLSIVTVESLQDLGYLVDSGAADGYGLGAPPAGVTGEAGAVRVGVGDDALPMPRWIVHPDGRVEPVGPSSHRLDPPGGAGG